MAKENALFTLQLASFLLLWKDSFDFKVWMCRWCLFVSSIYFDIYSLRFFSAVSFTIYHMNKIIWGLKEYSQNISRPREAHTRLIITNNKRRTQVHRLQPQEDVDAYLFSRGRWNKQRTWQNNKQVKEYWSNIKSLNTAEFSH